MTAKLSYLKRSATGFFSYRRRVPAHLRKTLGKAEWKVSFHTKDERLAHRLWIETNDAYDEACRLAELAQQNKLRSQSEVLSFAKSNASRFGFSPDLRPKPPTVRDPALWDNYDKEIGKWNHHIEVVEDLLLDRLDTETTDYLQMEKDYASGKWAQRGYNTPRKSSPNEALIDVSLQIASGHLDVSMEPTLDDARQNYIRVGEQDKERSPRKQNKQRNDINRVCKVIGEAFSGSSTKLSALDRQQIRATVWSAWPNVSTRNRYINTLNAMINAWNAEHSESVFNPFKGLTNKKAEQRRAEDRHPFTPKQWHSYIKTLEAYSNEQARLIGLIMTYTGCRTEEASGLEVRDVKLTAEVPHFVFRDNDIRTLDKKGLDRAVPIVPKLLAHLEKYDAPSESNAAYFPRYGHDNGPPTVSALLSKQIRNTMKIGDTRVVPYSTRHTLHDMMSIAGIPEKHQQYLVGHKTRASSMVHDQYGTTMPPKFLLDSLVSALEVEDWGYFED